MRKHLLITAALLASLPMAAEAAWQPNRPIEFVVTSGAGGGTDNFARVVQAIILKHKFVDQPIVVTNKGGGSAAPKASSTPRPRPRIPTRSPSAPTTNISCPTSPSSATRPPS